MRSVLQNAEVSGDSERVPAALPTNIAKRESPDYAIGYTAGYLDGAADLIASWSRMRHTVGPPPLLTTPTPEAHAASVHGRSGQRSDGSRVAQPSLEAVVACHKRVQLWERTSKVRSQRSEDSFIARTGAEASRVALHTSLQRRATPSHRRQFTVLFLTVLCSPRAAPLMHRTISAQVGTLYACERQRELDRWQSWALATNW